MADPWEQRGGEGAITAHPRRLAKLVTRQFLGLQTTPKSTAADTSPRTQLGELTALRRSPSWWRGGWLPTSPKKENPAPASAFRPRRPPRALAKTSGSALAERVAQRSVYTLRKRMKTYRWRDASQRDSRPFVCSWRHLANETKDSVTAVDCCCVLYT